MHGSGLRARKLVNYFLYLNLDFGITFSKVTQELVGLLALIPHSHQNLSCFKSGVDYSDLLAMILLLRNNLYHF